MRHPDSPNSAGTNERPGLVENTGPELAGLAEAGVETAVPEQAVSGSPALETAVRDDAAPGSAGSDPAEPASAKGAESEPTVALAPIADEPDGDRAVAAGVRAVFSGARAALVRTPALISRTPAVVSRTPAVLARYVAGSRESVAVLGRAWRRRRSATPVPGELGVPADAATALLGRLTVLPALLIAAWLLPALPLLLGGSFLPVPMLLISVPLAVALTVNGLREVPASWPQLRSYGSTKARTWAAWFGLLATVAVVVGLIAWQLREGSEALIVTRDPGTYLQTGFWIAQHGSLPIPAGLNAFGGPHPGLNFGSVGFLASQHSVVPAVLPGLPLLLAGGFWVHGITTATALGPVLGGLATLAFAGLVARLVGPQWAPAGALVLGLSLPQQYVSRTSLSETALEIMLLGGLCLLADSLALKGRVAPVPVAAGGEAGLVPDETRQYGLRQYGLRGSWRRLASWRHWAGWLTPERALALLAGLCLGLSLVISLDGLVYVLPAIPFAAILIGGRKPQATPFLIGFVVGCGYGALSGYLLDRPLIDSVGTTLAIAGVAAVWLAAPSIVALQLPKFASIRQGVPRLLARRPLRWLPELGALLVVAVLAGFAVRPYVQTVRGHPSVAVYYFVKELQRAQGLPVDPTRLYSEQTLYWVVWYIGLPTVLLGAIGAALLVRRCLRGLLTWRDPAGIWRIWGLPLAIICAGSVVALWAPDIVPDQPWASRRLLVIVIPGLIICGLWAAALLAGHARNRGARPVTAAVAGLFCVAAMLVPAVSTTFGIGLSHEGKAGGLRPVAQGLALQRIGRGQINAVASLCAQIPRGASVLILSRPVAQEFTQTIRGMCGVPVAWLAGQPRAAVDTVINSIAAAGRRPVLLASRRALIAPYGGSPVRVLNLATSGDPHQLTQLPTALAPVRYVIWMTSPVGPGTGA